MWVRITHPEKGSSFKQWVMWVKNIIRWRYSAFKRAMKDPFRWFKKRKRISQINRRIELACEESRAGGKYDPPTPEEIGIFVKWAVNHGISFENRVQPMPKLPRNSREVDITNSGGDYA